MNTVSTFVYLAQVFDSLQALSDLCALAIGLFLIAYNIAAACHNEDNPKLPRRKYLVWPVYVMLSFALLTALIPSKQTMYMIAASESAEYVSKTEIAQDVYDVLKKELKKMKESK